MPEKNFYRLRTAHRTSIFVDNELHIVHKPLGDETDLPLYVKEEEEKFFLFLINGNRLDYIARIKRDGAVELSDKPSPLEGVIKNADGSLAVKMGTRFLSARREGGKFALAPRNLGWEHFSPMRTAFIDVANDGVFKLRTLQGDRVFLDDTFTIQHKQTGAQNDLELYAQMSSDELSLFVIKNNAVNHIRAIDAGGKVLLSEERCLQKFVHDEFNDSIVLWRNGKFLSARNNSTRFMMATENVAQGHLSLEKINIIECGGQDVVLILFNNASLESVLDRLNLPLVNIRAIAVGGKTADEIDKMRSETRLPLFSLDGLADLSIDCREMLWLLSGGAVDERKKMSEYLQGRGIARSSIIDFTLKMNVTPTWSADVKAALTDECDFILTGDSRAAAGFDLSQIDGRRGINLAADGQDLRQSYLVAHYILDRHAPTPPPHDNFIKFVLIGLTPDSLSDDCFSERGQDCRYIFVDECSSIDGKIFDRLLKAQSEAPTEIPHHSELDAIPNAGDRNATVSDKALRQLEDYIRLCLEHDAKPVGVILPSPNEDYPKIKLLRHILRNLEKIYDFICIDLSNPYTFMPDDSLFETEGFTEFDVWLHPNSRRVLTHFLKHQLKERGII